MNQNGEEEHKLVVFLKSSKCYFDARLLFHGLEIPKILSLCNSECLSYLYAFVMIDSISVKYPFMPYKINMQNSSGITNHSMSLPATLSAPTILTAMGRVSNFGFYLFKFPNFADHILT